MQQGFPHPTIPAPNLTTPIGKVFHIFLSQNSRLIWVLAGAPEPLCRDARGTFALRRVSIVRAAPSADPSAHLLAPVTCPLTLTCPTRALRLGEPIAL